MDWKVNFFDKHGDETRSLVVVAASEDAAEEAAAVQMNMKESARLS